MKTLVLLAGTVLVISVSTVALSVGVSVRDELAKQGLLSSKLGDWKEAKNILGLPYVFIEPENRGEFRANISVTPIGENSNPIPMALMQATESEYQKGRIDYLGENEGMLLRFLAPSHRMRDKKTRVHEFGYEYELVGQAYHEESHFIFCTSGEMFMVKGIAGLKTRSQVDMKEFMRGFKCGGG